jgi:hypothetical protein
MSSLWNRRQFLKASAAGGAAIAGQALAPWAMTALGAAMPEGWPAMTPVRIYTVFVGRTGGIYLSRPTAEIQKFQEHLAGLEQKFGDVKFVGGEQLPAGEGAVEKVVENLKDADALLMFHLQGHGGDAPQQIMARLLETGLPAAVFSQPYSGHGWMYFPQWQKDGRKVVLLPTSDWAELDRIVGLMRVGPHLARTRILVVRGPVGTAAACNADLVKQRLGAELVPVTVEQTNEAHAAVDLKAAEAEAQEYWIGPARKIVEPTREEIVSAARYYLALRDMMIRERAVAVTSSNCMGGPAKGCLAFSKLNDLGLVGACEGDVDSTLTMLMFKYAFGVPGFITDPVFDTSRNALIHFHCTSATRMDGPAGERHPFTIRTQTDSGRGVALAVEFRVGQPVTCAKFVNLDTMLISTGKIIEVTQNDLGCRTQFVTEVRDARSMFMNWGAGVVQGGVMAQLHRAVFYGDHMQSIRNLGVLMGFKVVEEG